MVRFSWLPETSDPNSSIKYYYLLPDGGYKFGKINANNAVVYEEDRKDAYLARAGTRNNYSDRAHFWLIPRFFVEATSFTYTIHVPRGTIKVEHNLNLR